ncbi:MAG: polysaccharide biosynthesis tyrosine autokinase [Chloroflexi bacterium]|nr:MAG: polysaccharide biosynthesis tyrosine autokinase [Chloroflexota bacterium]
MEIRQYIRLIWRWLWLIILGAIIAGGTAYVISKNTVPIYRASSRLLIDEAPGSGSNNEYAELLVEQRLTQTYLQILSTRPVMEETITRLNLPYTPEQLAAKVSASSPQDTQIIIISVEDPNPELAAQIANTLGEVFIEQNRERESLRYAEPIQNWETRLDEIGNEIQAIETEINALGTPETPEEEAELSRKDTKLKELQIQYTEAFNNLNQLRVSQAKESSNIVPIEPAQPPQRPIRPRTFTNTIMATIIGGMVALGFVFLMEYLDDTIKTPDDVLADTNLPTLGAIAFIKGSAPNQRLITHHTPRDPISEAYRVLRTNLTFSAVDSELHSLLITSSSPGEGKSTTTANLAVVMAQTGKQVILVDADLRRPTQHKIFQLSNNQGLTTAILDSLTPVSYHLQKTRVPGLRVMTSGPIPPNPAELLNSHRMKQVLEALQQEADLIIFDTPPVLTVADAAILAPRVNGCVVVAEAGSTRRPLFLQAIERLARTGTNLYGVVMNRSKPGRASYYDDYYYYATYEYVEGRRKKRRRRSRSLLPGWITAIIKR